MIKHNNVHKVWVVMMLLTILAYTIGKQGYSGVFITLFLLTTVWIKSYLVIADFMELRGVSFLWRAIMYGWLWTVCIGIAIAIIIGGF